MEVMMAPSSLTASVRILGPIRGAAAVFGLVGRFQISTRLGLELRFAARAAEQHLVAVVRFAMGRIWFHRHAADGILQFRSVRMGMRHGALRACISSPGDIPYGGIKSSTREGYMERSVSEKVLKNLNRVEGQVRGIAKMVEEDRYCIDVVTQIEAARAALARIESDLLRQHLGHCVHRAMNSKNASEQEKIIEELVGVFRR
jgi:DNA-binding FrmR family transcriptional regulator